MPTRPPTELIVRTSRSAVVFVPPVCRLEVRIAVPGRVRDTPTALDRRAPRGRLVDVYA